MNNFSAAKLYINNEKFNLKVEFLIAVLNFLLFCGVGEAGEAELQAVGALKELWDEREGLLNLGEQRRQVGLRLDVGEKRLDSRVVL